MHLRWVFTVETAVILLKNIFEFTFNKARRFRQILVCVPRGLVVKTLARCVGGLEFDFGHNLFLFASFLFFSSFFFSVSFPLVFILGITVLLCFYI